MQTCHFDWRSKEKFPGFTVALLAMVCSDGKKYREAAADLTPAPVSTDKNPLEHIPLFMEKAKS